MAVNKPYFIRWHKVGAGTVWPVPDTGMGDLEWRLRYGNPDRADLLAAASVVAAYRQMVHDTRQAREAVVRELRHAG